MSELLVKSESLTAVADSIRSKAGSTEELVFPEGFVSAVERIEVGIDKIKEALVSIGIEVGDGDTSTEVAEKIAENGFPIVFWNDRITATNMDNMFRDCKSLTTVPLFDTSSVTSMNSMFQNCNSLTTVPLFDTSSVTSMNSMFTSCKFLTTVPLFDTSSVTSMTCMFQNCYFLKTVPLFDTSSVTSMYAVFGGCRSLTTVPLFDIRNVTSMNSTFVNCSSLTECWLRNIKTNLQVGSGATSGHLLTVESLLHLIKECRDTGSTKTMTIGTANIEKLANTYVKLVDITDEMRAEDDLIDEKLPFEVCESTDEGAMLITEYVLLKNWQLK